MKITAIQFLKDNQYHLLHLSLKDEGIEQAELSKERLEENSLERLQKKFSLLCIPFPLENSYLYETMPPCNISKKVKDQILSTASEMAIPSREEDCEVYSLPVGKKGTSDSYLQFLLPREKLPFKNKGDRAILQMDPGALFQGLSFIFKFPQGETCVILLKGDENFQLLWGKNGKMLGLRVFRSSHFESLPSFLEQTFQQDLGLQKFFSWVDEETRRSLDRRAYPWIHLKGDLLPKPIQGMQDELFLVATAVAFSQGLLNPAVVCESVTKTLWKNNLIKKSLTRSALLLFLSMFCAEFLGSVGLYQKHKEKDFLEIQMEKEFHQIFPPDTPLLNPLEQLKEKLGSAGVLPKVTPSLFLKALSSLYRFKSTDIEIGKIFLEQDSLKLEGVGSSVERIQQWVEDLKKEKGDKIRLIGIDRSGEEGKWFFSITVDV